MSRILFNLKLEDNDKGIIYPTQDQLQGFAYFLIKQAGFEKLHNLPQNLPRFFNFSQIFGGKKKDDNFYFIFSTPLNPLIDKILTLKLLDKEVRVGQNLFVVEKVKMIKYKLREPFRLVAETPIIVRVPANRFKDYGLELDKKYKWFYWRPLMGKNVPFRPFINQLESRVYKLFKLFKGLGKIEERPIFSKFLFKKSIDLPYFKNGHKLSRIGTLWEFEIFPKADKELIYFILDTGLGELTSQGYGFVNLGNSLF